jgi:hypothetical protein
MILNHKVETEVTKVLLALRHTPKKVPKKCRIIYYGQDPDPVPGVQIWIRQKRPGSDRIRNNVFDYFNLKPDSLSGGTPLVSTYHNSTGTLPVGNRYKSSHFNLLNLPQFSLKE